MNLNWLKELVTGGANTAKRLVEDRYETFHVGGQPGFDVQVNMDSRSHSPVVGALSEYLKQADPEGLGKKLGNGTLLIYSHPETNDVALSVSSDTSRDELAPVLNIPKNQLVRRGGVGGADVIDITVAALAESLQLPASLLEAERKFHSPNSAAAAP